MSNIAFVFLHTIDSTRNVLNFLSLLACGYIDWNPSEDFFREIEVLQKFKCEFRIFLTQIWCIKLSVMTRWQHCRLPTYRGVGSNQNLSEQLQKTGNLRLTLYMILYIFSPSKIGRANAHRTHPVPTPLNYIIRQCCPRKID